MNRQKCEILEIKVFCWKVTCFWHCKHGMKKLSLVQQQTPIRLARNLQNYFFFLLFVWQLVSELVSSCLFVAAAAFSLYFLPHAASQAKEWVHEWANSNGANRGTKKSLLCGLPHDGLSRVKFGIRMTTLITLAPISYFVQWSIKIAIWQLWPFEKHHPHLPRPSAAAVFFGAENQRTMKVLSLSLSLSFSLFLSLAFFLWRFSLLQNDGF
jgi:hypothetical protein